MSLCFSLQFNKDLLKDGSLTYLYRWVNDDFDDDGDCDDDDEDDQNDDDHDDDDDDDGSVYLHS